MLIGDIDRLICAWAPSAVAWDKDNVGLNIGDPHRKVSRILVTLDTTPAVVDEAARRGAELIVSHHPLIFQPVSSITTGTRTGGMVLTLARKRIGLIAAHTNFDFTAGGVSFTLAGKLGLRDITLLSPHVGTTRKIAVFVPARDADRVMESMAAAGAGIIGDYSRCSFRTIGTGTFRAGDRSHPSVGKKGRLEIVEEVRLEMEFPEWKSGEVISAMKAAHPYEEVAYDILTLGNESRSHGIGAIGELKGSVSTPEFLRTVKRKLQAGALRYSGPSGRRIRRVAVCGGSGSELVSAAVSGGADAFVTGDVRYHTFQEHETRLLLVDAGHYETEQPAVRTLADYLRSDPMVRKARVTIFESKQNRNPVRYHR